MESQLFEKAWKCIIQEYFTFACEKSAVEGKCIHIFHFLEDKKAAQDYNCNYFYSKPGGSAWGDIIEDNEENKKVVENYDPDSMILICIRVPHSHNCSHESVTEQLKLIYCDTKMEVDTSNTRVHDNTSKKSPPNTCGLRKRKV